MGYDIPEDKPFYHAQATLACGARLDIVQLERHTNLIVTVTPKDGIPIKDSAEIKDNTLVLRITIDSLLGIQQLLDIMSGRARRTPERKKIFGIF